MITNPIIQKVLPKIDRPNPITQKVLPKIDHLHRITQKVLPKVLPNFHSDYPTNLSKYRFIRKSKMQAFQQAKNRMFQTTSSRVIILQRYGKKYIFQNFITEQRNTINISRIDNQQLLKKMSTQVLYQNISEYLS